MTMQRCVEAPSSMFSPSRFGPSKRYSVALFGWYLNRGGLLVQSDGMVSRTNRLRCAQDLGWYDDQVDGPNIHRKAQSADIGLKLLSRRRVGSSEMGSVKRVWGQHPNELGRPEGLVNRRREAIDEKGIGPHDG